MIRCEVIENFNLGEFYKLSNIARAGGRNDYGKLYVHDSFECDEDMANYLSGGNKDKKVVVKVIEILPTIKVLSQSPVEELEKAIKNEGEITIATYDQPKKKKTSKK